MSLTGNLEDLPLLDILQIVSFSKKTGFLSIRTSAGEGAIVFEQGFMVSSFTWDSPPPDPRFATLPPDKRAGVLRGRVEAALEQLVRLREGQFNFSLTDEVPKRIGNRVIVDETLADGINAQELLLDLARGMDEDRRDSTAALEASFAEPEEAPAAIAESDESFSEEFVDAEPAAPSGVEITPLPAAAGAGSAARAAGAPSSPAAAGAVPRTEPGAEARPILLVDDETEVRQIVADHLVNGGYQVVEAEDPDTAVKKAGRLGKAGLDFVLITDLGMPTSGGSSFQGGFEVIKRLWKMNLHPPVLLMTDSLSPTVQARAKQMGITSFVFKPGLSKLDPEQFAADLRAFAQKMLRDVLPRLLEAPAAAPAQAAQGSGQAPGVVPPAPAPADDVSREFAALLERLAELRRRGDASQIASLVMKVAREFFERSLLLLVKNEELRGLGGFGAAPRNAGLSLVAREVVIPLSQPSVFLDVVMTRKPYRGPLPDGRWSQYLLGKIGRFRSSEAALLPLLTNRETVAVLFGDNPETGRGVGRLEALEVFINQAGVAMENAFLQRKVQTLQGRE